MEFFQSLGHQLSAIWSRLSGGHRIIMVLLVLLSVGAIMAVMTWAGRHEYQVLYTDLTPKECAALASSLKDAGIPVRVAEGGSAIMVATGKLPEARMVAAEKGLPSGDHSGFESFKNPKIGITPFAEKINYLSALQNELAATICSLDSVKYARVHLVVPERSLFKDDSRKPSAAVLVVTTAGSLSPAQARGIANLVARAVEGLATEDVTITDARGNVLAGGEDTLPLAAGDQFAHRLRVENYLSAKAEEMLAKVLGPGRCEVQVSAQMAFEDSTETKKVYDPTQRALLSEKIESRKSTGSTREVGGVAGSAGNTPAQGQTPATQGGATPQPMTTPSQETSENIESKYAVGESILQTVRRGASIKKLTVAAFVDLSAIQAQAAAAAVSAAAAEGAPAAAPAASAPQATGPKLTVAQIEQIVKDAVGLDEKRGDSLQIVEAAVQQPPVLASVEGEGAPPWASQVGQYVAIAVLGLVLLVIARRVVRSIEQSAPRHVVIPEIMGAEGGEAFGGRMNQDELIRREINKFVEGSPEAASRMLEGWVEGEE